MSKNFGLIALLFLFLLIGTNAVEACTCKGRPRGVKGVQTCGYYWGSENIFIGLAEKIEIDREIGSMKVTFSVEKTIRGTNEKTVEIFTSASTASCGYPFKQGEKYFVYGRKGSDGKYHEGLCGPTVLLKDAEDDLEYAKDIEEGKPGTRIFGNVFEDRQSTSKDKHTFEPLSGVEITIKNKQNKYQTLTDEKGNYLFKDIPKENFQIFAKFPKGYREIFVRPNSTGRFVGSCDGENFRVTKQGSIRGKVVNFPSNEIQNPWDRDLVQQPKVSLVPLDENNKPIANYYEEKWAYRDKFEYFFDIVPAGNYLLAINPKNCPYPSNGVPTMFFPGVADHSEAKIITVKEGENLNLSDFKSLPLLKERWFSGVVLYADKTPAAKVNVRLLDKDMNNCNNFHLETKTDEFGNFKFKGFENYEYQIVANTERNQGQKQFYAKPFLVTKEAKTNAVKLILDRSF